MTLRLGRDHLVQRLRVGVPEFVAFEVLAREGVDQPLGFAVV
ncbi:hypothetical protein OH805_36775 [Streptomyces sp. NBC_00879]|nr:hypothetical protein OH805_36775 [Streptomyces sp. NBC_00879]